MSQLVVLELDGDLKKQGFRITLEVNKNNAQGMTKKGHLPPNPTLATLLQSHWQEKYRALESPFRVIKPEKIINKGSVTQRIRDCQASAQQLRREFQTWLDSEEFRFLDKRLREELQREEEICLLIRTQDMLVKKLPWSEWDLFERYSKAEPAFSALESEPIISCFKQTLKKNIRVLAIVGHQAGIDVKADLLSLQELPNLELTILLEPNHSDINQQLWEEGWNIIFFAGHSHTEGETGKIHINPTETLTIDELWYGLRKAVEYGLKLAIFNSCDGLGLSHKLNDLRIPQMIVMRDLVPDVVAQKFLAYFLKSFAMGQSFYVAVREARQRLHDELETSFPCASWLPVICQHPEATPISWEDFSEVSPVSTSDKTVLVKSQNFTFSSRKLGIGIMAVLLFIIVSFFSIPKYINRIGVKAIDNNQFQKALIWLKIARIINPNYPSARSNLAYVYQRLDNIEESRKLYEGLKNDGHSGGCNGYAFLDIQEGRYERAERVLVTCKSLLDLEDKGKFIEYVVLKNLGWAFLMNGDYEEAEIELREAINLYPKEGIANCVLAQVLEKTQRENEALGEWELCLENARDDLPEEVEWKKRARDVLN